MAAPEPVTGEEVVVLVTRKDTDSIYECIKEDLIPFYVRGVMLRVGAVYSLPVSSFTITDENWNYNSPAEEDEIPLAATDPTLAGLFKMAEKGDRMSLNFVKLIQKNAALMKCSNATFRELPITTVAEWFNKNENLDCELSPLPYFGKKLKSEEEKKEVGSMSIDTVLGIGPAISPALAAPTAGRSIDDEQDEENAILKCLPEGERPKPVGTKYVIGNAVVCRCIEKATPKNHGDGTLYTVQMYFWNNAIQQRVVLFLTKAEIQYNLATERTQRRKMEEQKRKIGPDTSNFHELMKLRIHQTGKQDVFNPAGSKVILKVMSRYDEQKKDWPLDNFVNTLIFIGNGPMDLPFSTALDPGITRTEEGMCRVKSSLVSTFGQDVLENLNFNADLLRSATDIYKGRFTVWQHHYLPFYLDSANFQVSQSKKALTEIRPPDDPLAPGEKPFTIFNYDPNDHSFSHFYPVDVTRSYSFMKPIPQLVTEVVMVPAGMKSAADQIGK